MSNRIPPLSAKELEPFRFQMDIVEKSMGFVPNSMKTMARVPAILYGFSSLAGILLGDPKKVTPWKGLKMILKNLRNVARFSKKKDRIPLYLRSLVAHISSKASGCRYCQAHTIGEAKSHGTSEEKLNHIWEFQTHPAFSDKERAALNFAMAAGSVPNAVTNEHFDDLKKHFDYEQIIELGAVVSLFGFLNRWNDTFATQLESMPLANATTYLSKQGWEIGPHQ